MDQLTGKLLGGQSCAIHGAQGIGKTRLVQEIIHSAEVLKAFPEGVLWGSIGSGQDPNAMFGRWAEELGIARATIAQLTRVQDRARAVANAVDSRRMLIVCDDCETIDAAYLVNFIGSNSVRLLTTRSPQVAQAFAGADTVELAPLSVTDAWKVLRAVAPVVDQYPEAAEKAVRTFDCNPGRLVAFGRLLKDQPADAVGSVIAKFA